MWTRNVLALVVIVNIFVPIKTQRFNEALNNEDSSNSHTTSDNSQSAEDEHGSSASETLNNEDSSGSYKTSDNSESAEAEDGSSSSETLNNEHGSGSQTISESQIDSTDNSQSAEDEHTIPTESSTSGNYITKSPITTNHPSSSLSSDNEIYSGQIPLERPTESVSDALGNNIPSNLPALGNNPSISDSDGYGVTDANGQDYTDPNGKPITVASGGQYGFSVTNPDGSVFTETVFIGGQSTASYSGDITTISNDSSNNVTAATESNTEGLVTDGAEQFPTSDDSATTETEIIGGQSTASYNANTTTISNDSSNNVIAATESNTEGLVTDGAEQFPTSGSVSTQSANEAIQSGIDIFNVSTDMHSETNPITRGTCGLPKGGAMIQQAIPPVTTSSRGLIWSSEDKALYFVDVYKPAVSKYTPTNGRLVTLNLDGLVAKAIFPTSTKHQFVVALDDRLVLLQNSFTKDENVTTYKKVLAQFDSIYDLGVAKTDLQGRIWIPVRVTISNGKIVTKLYLICDGKAEYRDTLRRNYGMAWSADNKYFYVADSESEIGYIYVYDFESKDGSIKNRRILFNQNNYPKLSAQISDIVVDKKGNIWASIFEYNLVIKIDHLSGNILEMIALPTKYPSSLAFGTVKQDKLFVGTAYTSSREMDIPYTYVISKLEATGISATKKVQLKKIFGPTTINISVSNADHQIPPSDVTPTDSSTNEICPINKTLLEIRDRSAGECTVVKNKPVIQEAIAPLETTVQGLHWDFRTNALYLADVHVPALIKYTPHNGKTVTVKFENTTTITAIVPIKNKDHNYIISSGHSLVQFENKFKENSVQELNGQVIASLKGKDKNMIFSRGRTDSQGRLWIGTRFIQPSRSKGALYMLQRGKLISKISKVVDSGGMTWSLDQKHFYFVDTGEGIIYSYDYNAWTGAIRNRKIFFDIKTEPSLNGTLADIIIDNKDNIWASVYGGSVVICISRKTGCVSHTIPLPIKYPVSLEFGGVKRDTLFVSGTLRNTCKVETMPYTYAISNTGVRGTNANYYYTL